MVSSFLFLRRPCLSAGRGLGEFAVHSHPPLFKEGAGGGLYLKDPTSILPLKREEDD